MHFSAGAPILAPPAQRVSGKNTLTAGSVNGAVGHRNSSHTLRCSHVKQSLQKQTRSELQTPLRVSSYRCDVYLGQREDHVFDPLRLPEDLNLFNYPRTTFKQNYFVDES